MVEQKINRLKDLNYAHKSVHHVIKNFEKAIPDVYSVHSTLMAGQGLSTEQINLFLTALTQITNDNTAFFVDMQRKININTLTVKEVENIIDSLTNKEREQLVKYNLIRNERLSIRE